jgi:hypothetical protein
MKRPQFIIPDEGLAQYVYHCMAMATEEQKRNLSHSEIAHMRSEAHMRKFSENGSLDARLSMLVRLGYSACVVVGDPKQDYNPVFAELLTQSDFPMKRLAITEAMAAKRLFVMSSREVLVSLHLAAMNSHGSTYHLNQRLARIGKDRQNSRAKMSGTPSALSQGMEDALFAIEDTAALALKLWDVDADPESIVGVNQKQMQVLMALLPMRGTFVHVDEIMRRVGLAPKGAKGWAMACTELAKRRYIQRLPDMQRGAGRKRNEFTIMETGIDTVVRYTKWLLRMVM